MGAAWTSKGLKELGRIYSKFDMASCALILDRSIPSIAYQVKLMGVKSTRNTAGNQRKIWAEDIANMMEFRNAGFSWKEIAKCTGISHVSARIIVQNALSAGFDKYPKRELV